jgi:hypothetical protein
LMPSNQLYLNDILEKCGCAPGHHLNQSLYCNRCDRIVTKIMIEKATPFKDF